VSDAVTTLDADDTIPSSWVRRLPCHKKLKRFVEWYPCKLMFAAGIIGYALLLGVEVEKDRLLTSQAQVNNLERADMLLTFLFVVEILLKLYVYGQGFVLIKNNAKDPDFYHATDVAITAASILHVLMVSTQTGREYKATIQFLKTFRLARLFRLFTLKRELKIIIDGFVRSILSLFWVFVVLVVITYGCTVFCANMIGKATYPDTVKTLDNFDNVDLFGTIPKCMLTLFSMLILSEWDSVVRPIMKVQPFLVLFFISFTILVTFGMMNVVVGIIVDTVATVKKQNDDKRQQVEKNGQMRRFQALMEDIVMNLASPEGTSGEPCFSEEDFLSCANQVPDLQNLMGEIDFPHGFTLQDLYVMLDHSGDNMVGESEFVSGMSQLVFGNDFQRACILQLSLHRLKKFVHYEVGGLRAGLESLKQKVQHFGGELQNTKDSIEQGKQGTEPPSALSSQPVKESKVSNFISSTQKSIDTIDEPFDPLRAAALEHCKQEVAKAQEELETCANLPPSDVTVDFHRDIGHQMPRASAAKRSHSW